jgi:hypothetical protein
MHSALLVHGLGRTPVSLFPLAGVVRQAGVRPHFFGYVAAVESIRHIVERLKRKLSDLRPDFLIAHSLGGILLRLAMADLTPWPARHFVMLGTPNRPPRLARMLHRYPPFHWAFGDCGRFLASPAEYERLPPLAVPHTVIAGTAGPCGRLSPFGADANDGVVAVSETKLDDGHEPVLVPAWHTWMMAHPAVKARVGAIMSVKRPHSGAHHVHGPKRPRRPPPILLD